MKKIVFMNPIALFFLWYLFLLFTALFLAAGMIDWPSLSSFVLSYIGNVFAVILAISWPYALYKYLSSYFEDDGNEDRKKFNILLLASLFLPPALLGLVAIIEYSQIPANLASFVEGIMVLIIIVVYIPLIQLLWRCARILKGGLGWFFVILYWPLTAYWIQKHIKTLYPKSHA